MNGDLNSTQNKPRCVPVRASLIILLFGLTGFLLLPWLMVAISIDLFAPILIALAFFSYGHGPFYVIYTSILYIVGACWLFIIARCLIMGNRSQKRLALSVTTVIGAGVVWWMIPSKAEIDLKNRRAEIERSHNEQTKHLKHLCSTAKSRDYLRVPEEQRSLFLIEHQHNFIFDHSATSLDRLFDNIEYLNKHNGLIISKTSSTAKHGNTPPRSKYGYSCDILNVVNSTNYTIHVGRSRIVELSSGETVSERDEFFLPEWNSSKPANEREFDTTRWSCGGREFQGAVCPGRVPLWLRSKLAGN